MKHLRFIYSKCRPAVREQATAGIGVPTDLEVSPINGKTSGRVSV
jgi:hypothetical protein